MADHKQNKNEKDEQKNGARGFDNKDHPKEKDVAAVAKKTPTTIKNDGEKTEKEKKLAKGHVNQKPSGGQEGMRPKSKMDGKEESKGSKSRADH